MATSGQQTRESFVAGADLSAAQFTFVTMNTSDRTVVTTGAGAEADGILINDPISGQAATVVVIGRERLLVGTGGLTAGDSVASDANGAAVTAGTGDIILGKAVQSAAAGEFATIDFYRGGNAAA